MRIIAGRFKGKKIISPNEKNVEIRPTLDRIKVPLFDIIKPYLDGAIVLDLFAGSGALGLEAISRGASKVVFNDINKEALSVISSNVRLTQATNYAKITRKEYDKCIKALAQENEKFDIIFLDPPYMAPYEQDALNLIVDTKILKPDGIVVLESDKRKEFNEEVCGLEIIDKRTYGRVTIRIYKWEE